MTRRSDDVGVSTSLGDARVGRPPRQPRPDAVDDKLVREELQRAGRHAGPGRLRVSISRIHDELVSFGLRWPVKTLRHLDFVDSDLAGSRITGGWFGRVAIDDCTFERVRLDRFDGSKLDISGSRFERVVFSGPGHGALTDSSITGSVFERCDLRDVTFRRCRLEDVTFDRPRTSRTKFRETRIVNARFAGRHDSIFFVDSAVVDVDFSAAEPRDLVFIGTALKSVRFPRARQCFVVTKPIFHEVALQVLGRLSPDGAKRLGIYAGMFDTDEPVPIVVGRGMLAAFKDPADEAVLVDALLPHAITQV